MVTCLYFAIYRYIYLYVPINQDKISFSILLLRENKQATVNFDFQKLFWKYVLFIKISFLTNKFSFIDFSFNTARRILQKMVANIKNIKLQILLCVFM